MKKGKLVFVSALIASLVFMSAPAVLSASIESGKCGANLTYEYDSYDDTLTIEGTGKMKNYGTGSYAPPWSDWNVKEVIIKDGVTSIGDYAFDNSTNITDSSVTKVTLPGSITLIGKQAFGHCKLSKFNFPTGLVTIDSYAFFSASLPVWNLPDTLESIGRDAFRDTNVVSISIPDNVTKLGASVFSGCENLVSVKLSENLDEISNGLFWKCSSLTNITIPTSVTTIGASAFGYCGSLRELVIHDGINDVGESILIGADDLRTISIPAISQLEYLFGDADSIPDSLTTVNITSGEIPRIFARGCTSITKVNIGSKVTSISDKAFYDCTSLREVAIEGELDNIPSEAFRNCSALRTISIPERVTSVSADAFNSCTRLKDIYYGGSRYEWRALQIASGNDVLKSSNVHYAKTEPMAYRITGISTNGGIKVDLTKDYPCDGPMIVATYNSNGGLIDTKLIEVNMQIGETKQISIEIPVAGATSVSAFVWDTFDSIIPASNKAYKSLT